MMNRCNGFTLVETLISLVMLSLILSIGLNVLYVGSRNWQHISEVSQRHNEWRQSIALLGRLLRHAQATNSDSEFDKEWLLFSGNHDQLTFTAPLTQTGRGLYRLNFWLEREHALQNLQLSYQLLQSTEDTTNRLTLMKDIQEISFSYYGADDDNAIKRWHETWEGKRHSPRLVRLSIVRDTYKTNVLFGLPIDSVID